jgi:hypothetical protein
LKAGEGGVAGRWYFGPTMQALEESINPAVAKTIENRRR